MMSKSIFCCIDKSKSYNLEGKSNDGLSYRVALTQIIISLLGSLSVLASGMGLGYPSITSQLLTQGDVALSSSQVSWFASITAIACPFGAPLSGYLCDKIGRRNTLLALSVIAIVSWLLMGFSSRVNVDILFTQLMIARAIIGIQIGMTTAPIVMYVSEVCHPNLRGRMTLMSSPFFTATGLLVIYFLGFMIPNDFRLVSLIAGGITLMALIVCIILPESPVFLVTQNKLEKARKALALLRNLQQTDELIDQEIEQIRLNKRIVTEKQSMFDNWKDLRKPELYKPFLVMVSFFTIQQFSGIFVIFIYASQFSIEAGVAVNDFLSAVIIGVIRSVTTIFIAFASDKFGRKPLALASGIGMFLSMVGLASCAAFPLKNTAFNWLPAVFLYAFIFTGTFGILTLPFAMVAEVFPQKSRGFAVGLTIAIAYALSFINIKTFSLVFETFGSFLIFTFYAVVALIGIVFAIFVLPETKGKSLKDIENIFRKS